MLSNKNQTGFTVVETLIVVAVTGMIFASTALLMRGQIAKYQYREGMHQIEQTFQNIVNNVENGTFGETDGTGSKLLVGRRIWFCADGVTVPSVCNGDPNSGSIMHVETVTNDASPNDYINDSPIALPSGIKFIGWAWLPASNISPLTLSTDEFGTSILLSDYAGKGVSSIDDVASGVNFYSRSGRSQADLFPALYGGRGLVICFEGNKRGSIELGSKTLGSKVKLNIADDRCG